MRQIEKRLEKLKESIRPGDNSVTLEELCRSMWQMDKRRYLQDAKEQFIMSSFIPQFEREDPRARGAQ